MSASRRLSIGAAAAFLLLALGMEWWKRRSAHPAAAAVRIAVRGFATEPAIAADGTLIAYAADGGAGVLHIWVQPAGGGEPWRITSGEAECHSPAFSPDGQTVAYRAEDGRAGSVQVVASRGGEPRRIGDGGRDPRFSPDGRRIAWWVKDAGGDQVWMADADGGAPRRICAACATARYPVWSPNGRRLLFSGTKDGQADWFAAPLDGGPPLATGSRGVLGMQDLGDIVPTAWVRGTVLFSGRSHKSGGIWRAPLSEDLLQCTGGAVQIATGSGWERQATAAGDGTVVYEASTLSATIWALPVEPAAGEPVRLAEAEVGRAGFSVSPDGRLVARYRGKGIATRDIEAGQEKTREAPGGGSRPVLSPDGTRVAWGARGGLYIAPIGGGEAQRAGHGAPVEWSRDRIVAQGWSRSVLAVYPANPKTPPREFLRHSEGIYQPRLSPDGKWMALHTRSSKGRRVWIVPPGEAGLAEESDWIPVTEENGESRDAAWSGNGTLLYYVSERDGFRCIWAQPLDAASRRPRGEPVAVRHFHGTRLSLTNPLEPAEAGLACTAGKLFFVLYERTGEIWRTRLAE